MLKWEELYKCICVHIVRYVYYTITCNKYSKLIMHTQQLMQDKHSICINRSRKVSRKHTQGVQI